MSKSFNIDKLQHDSNTSLKPLITCNIHNIFNMSFRFMFYSQRTFIQISYEEI